MYLSTATKKSGISISMHDGPGGPEAEVRKLTAKGKTEIVERKLFETRAAMRRWVNIY